MTLTNYTTKKNLRKLFLLLGLVLILLFPLYIYLFSFDGIDTSQSLCPFKMTTGFPCPGCGITKSIVYLYDGDIKRSLSYHIFGPFAFLFSFGLIIMLTIELIVNKEFFRKLFYNIKIAYFLALVLSTFHIVRIILFMQENNLNSILKESIWF